MKLIGKGLVIDAARGVEFPDYGELELNFGLAVLTVPAPAAAGAYVIPYDAPLTGKLVWYDLTPEMLAAATGNELASGTVRRREAEPHVVPSSPPYEVTLEETALLPLTDVVLGDDRRRRRRVAANPGPGEYVISGATLTFHSSDAGRTVYVDYFYGDAAAGQTLVVSPFALPGAFKLVGAVKLFDGGANDYAGELVVVAQSCRRTGPLVVGARAGDVASFGFDFALENRVPGDVAVYFP